jgi:cytochrome c oxidase subunit 2
MASSQQLYFIEFASFQMEGIYYLHEHIFGLIFGILIAVFVLYRRVLLKSFGMKLAFTSVVSSHNFIFIEQIVRNKHIKKITKKQLEIFWTIVPALILVYIAGPSFALLYAMDEIVPESYFTVLIQGAQWYWNYEYYLPFLNEAKISSSSYMVSESDLTLGQPRLLTVNYPVFIPRDIPVKLLVTSADVLHSWAVPALGIKVDAVPGRLNQVIVQPQRSGIFFGQCSEICGANHGFMPISVYCLSPIDLLKFFSESFFL